jgi:hypothetical protein
LLTRVAPFPQRNSAKRWRQCPLVTHEDRA